MKNKILVVDDEETLCEVLRFNLEEEGFLVDVAYSAEHALTMKLSDYSLVLLDIMMGEISGVQLARIIKSNPETARIPIIFCTAKDGEDDMIAGLELGADDYITKPYSLRNIIARVKTVLRRSSDDTAAPAPQTVSFKGIVLDLGSKLCSIDGVDLKLPKKEFEVLQTLVENKGIVFSRDELLKRIWTDEVIVVDRVIDVHINRLRRKLGHYGRHIVTRSGYGYGFIE